MGRRPSKGWIYKLCWVELTFDWIMCKMRFDVWLLKCWWSNYWFIVNLVLVVVTMLGLNHQDEWLPYNAKSFLYVGWSLPYSLRKKRRHAKFGCSVALYAPVPDFPQRRHFQTFSIVTSLSCGMATVEETSLSDDDVVPLLLISDFFEFLLIFIAIEIRKINNWLEDWILLWSLFTITLGTWSFTERWRVN